MNDATKMPAALTVIARAPGTGRPMLTDAAAMAPVRYNADCFSLDIAAELARRYNAHAALVDALKGAIADLDAEAHNEYDGTNMLADQLARADKYRAALAAAGEGR